MSARILVVERGLRAQSHSPHTSTMTTLAKTQPHCVLFLSVAKGRSSYWQSDKLRAVKVSLYGVLFDFMLSRRWLSSLFGGHLRRFNCAALANVWVNMLYRTQKRIVNAAWMRLAVASWRLLRALVHWRSRRRRPCQVRSLRFHSYLIHSSDAAAEGPASQVASDGVAQGALPFAVTACRPNSSELLQLAKQ
jgi:hypothetical protein